MIIESEQKLKKVGFLHGQHFLSLRMTTSNIDRTKFGPIDGHPIEWDLLYSMISLARFSLIVMSEGQSATARSSVV